MKIQTSSTVDKWHSQQAAMLLHYASLDYLKELHSLVNGLVNGLIEPLLDLADSQNRDALLIDRRWGGRNTSQNWGLHAWPMLKDLQASLAKDIAMRPMGRYVKTGVIDTLRGIDQVSTDWMSPGENRTLEAAFQALAEQAGRVDDTLSASNDNRWNDFHFAAVFPSFAAHNGTIPKFRVNERIVHMSGTLASQTGVYLSLDDIHASVQFVWQGSLVRDAKTFNEVGLAALNYVGREDLWINFNRMFDFATLKQYAPLFAVSVFLDGLPRPRSAPAAVASEAFTTRAQEWALLEIVENEFFAITSEPQSRPDREVKHRIEGGAACTIPGHYFTPSMANSRKYFSVGEVTPVFDARYGKTIWQWDANQD